MSLHPRTETAFAYDTVKGYAQKRANETGEVQLLYSYRGFYRGDYLGPTRWAFEGVNACVKSPELCERIEPQKT